MRKENHDSRVAWFIILENSREAHDFEKEAEARRNLKRLGVVLKYRRKRKGVTSGK